MQMFFLEFEGTISLCCGKLSMRKPDIEDRPNQIAVVGPPDQSEQLGGLIRIFGKFVIIDNARPIRPQLVETDMFGVQTRNQGDCSFSLLTPPPA
jgi:hypothetical protein